MSLTDLLLANLLLVAALAFGLWLVSLWMRDASIVDIFWGFGFVVIAWASYLAAGLGGARGLLITLLVTVWGLRLTGYLAWRNLGSGEDYRYQAMRARFGKRFPVLSLFIVFWFQALIMWIVAIPIQASALESNPLWFVDVVGVCFWATGFLFESVGDWQLAKFKADPSNQGKVMDRGLWRYTRHPNYFGDFMVWWGIYFIAAAAGAWWTVFSPIAMSVLLMRVSGVTLLERSLKKNRTGYEEYIARTSAFFPRPPRQPAPT